MAAKILRIKEGDCPGCNSNMIEYVAGPDSSDNEMWYECYCEDCGTEFYEIFEVTYLRTDIIGKRDDDEYK